DEADVDVAQVGPRLDGAEDRALPGWGRHDRAEGGGQGARGGADRGAVGGEAEGQVAGGGPGQPEGGREAAVFQGLQRRSSSWRTGHLRITSRKGPPIGAGNVAGPSPSLEG